MSDRPCLGCGAIVPHHDEDGSLGAIFAGKPIPIPDPHTAPCGLPCGQPPGRAWKDALIEVLGGTPPDTQRHRFNTSCPRCFPIPLKPRNPDAA